MKRKFMNQIIKWQTKVREFAARGSDEARVIAILCPQCQTWVKPRHCDRILLICTKCVRDEVDAVRGSMAHRRASVAAALARRRAQEQDHEREARDWRRTAGITATR